MGTQKCTLPCVFLVHMFEDFHNKKLKIDLMIYVCKYHNPVIKQRILLSALWLVSRKMMELGVQYLNALMETTSQGKVTWLRKGGGVAEAAHWLEAPREPSTDA